MVAVHFGQSFLHSGCNFRNTAENKSTRRREHFRLMKAAWKFILPRQIFRAVRLTSKAGMLKRYSKHYNETNAWASADGRRETSSTLRSPRLSITFSCLICCGRTFNVSGIAKQTSLQHARTQNIPLSCHVNLKTLSSVSPVKINGAPTLAHLSGRECTGRLRLQSWSFLFLTLNKVRALHPYSNVLVFWMGQK